MIIESTDCVKLSTTKSQQTIIMHPSLSMRKLINVLINSHQQDIKKKQKKITAFKGDHSVMWNEKDFRQQHAINHCMLLERSMSSASNLLL